MSTTNKPFEEALDEALDEYDWDSSYDFDCHTREEEESKRNKAKAALTQLHEAAIRDELCSLIGIDSDEYVPSDEVQGRVIDRIAELQKEKE